MERKTVSGIMLTLLLVSVIHLAALDSVARAIRFNGDLLDYGVFSETEDSWWMFRHDLNHTGYSNSTVHEYIEYLWNYTTQGEVRSSPAVVNGTVFVGSEDGYVYALNAATREPIKKSTNLSAVVSSPAVTEGRVFVGSLGSRNGSVYALDEATLGIIIWNFTTGGPVVSSPAVADGKVFVGSCDNMTYALDAKTNNKNGTQIWNFTTNGPVRSSPAIAYGMVFVGSEDGYVYALPQNDPNRDGRITPSEEKWRFRTADPVSSSPAVADGKVFVGVNDGRVYALNASTGRLLWYFETEGAVVSSPAVAYEMVFVGSNDTRVYALNATDGKQIWNFTTGGPVVSSPAVADNKVFVGSCDKQIYALNVTDPNGDGIISLEEVVWNFTTGGPVVSSPAIFEGKVFVGSLDKVVYAFAANKPPQASFTFYPESPIVTQTMIFDASASKDPEGYNITSFTWDFGDGTQVTKNESIATHAYNVAGTYNVNLTLRDNFKPAGTNETAQPITVLEAWPMFRHDPTHVGNSTSLAPVANETLWIQPIGEVSFSSPAVIDTTVFIGSKTETLYALNATNGNVIWSQNLSDPIYSSPAVVDNVVFIASENGTISAWDINGNFVWANHTQGRIYSSPTVSGNRIFIGSDSLYAFNKTNGNQLWATYLGGTVDSSPAVASGRVFVGSWNGTVYAIDETNGTVLKSYVIGPQIRIISSPAVAYGKVFIGAENGNIYALNMDCEHQWHNTTGGPIYSSPAVAHHMVFVGSDDGNMYAFDVTNGNKLWNKTIGSVWRSSPAVAEGKVFVGSTNGKIYALYEKSGKIVWNYTTGGSVDSSPAVLNDTLYVGSKDGNIYAFKSQVHDISITDVTPSLTRVVQNRTVNINVTIWNRGTFNETNINVTAYYYNSTFIKFVDSQTINLTRGAETGTEAVQPVNIRWDTTSIALGTYNVKANATLAPPAIDDYPEDNDANSSRTVEVVIREADLSCDAVTPYKNITGTNLKADGTNGDWTCTNESNCLPINVTVTNRGEFEEKDVEVTIYANATAVNQTTIPILLPNTSQTVTLTWNTTDFVKGNYNVTAWVKPVPTETNTTNNNCTTWVIVAMVGDIKGPDGWPDGTCDIRDVAPVASAFGAFAGDDRYDPNCDINCDGKIDVRDVAIVAINFGKIDP